MEGGFDRLGRIPGVELGPGVESPLGVGVLDFSPGVPALSRIDISLDLREEELADDAVEAGLQGSFLRRRALSRPFSLGEGRGVPRGEAGSSFETSTTKLSSLFSPSLS